MSIDFSHETEDLYDFSKINYGTNQQNSGCQHEVCKIDASTQTSSLGFSNHLGVVQKNFTWNNLNDLIRIFIGRVVNCNSIQERIFSVILYILIRFIGLSTRSEQEAFYHNSTY